VNPPREPVVPSRESSGLWGDCVPGSPATPLTDAGARFSRSDSGRRPQPWDARYLLVCHARSLSLINGVWCFTLESLTGDSLIEAEDEDEGDLNRLSLLAAVRGLEAIDGQSIVSLISNNRYLIRSLDSSLPRWRENDFLWEDFGRKVAVQNADLWRRIDRTLGIHEVTATLVQTTRVSSHRESPLGRCRITDEASHSPALLPTRRRTTETSASTPRIPSHTSTRKATLTRRCLVSPAGMASFPARTSAVSTIAGRQMATRSVHPSRRRPIGYGGGWSATKRRSPPGHPDAAGTAPLTWHSTDSPTAEAPSKEAAVVPTSHLQGQVHA